MRLLFLFFTLFLRALNVSSFQIHHGSIYNPEIVSLRSQVRQTPTSLFMSESRSFLSSFKFPSYSKSSKVSNAEEILSLKASIKELSKGTNNGITASPESRDKISEYVKKLEKLNPTSALTSAPILDGTWRLVYTTNEGSSAGKLGPFVGAVEQEIKLKDTIYYNRVTLGPNLVRGSLSATWDVKNAKLWTVKFQDITFELFGIPVLKKSLGGVVGTWRMSYLDQDMRILYAIGGKNTVVENVYILSK